MYEAIQAQPEVFARVSAHADAAASEWARRIASCARVYIAGIGTSHHAAQVGAHLFRAYGGGVPTSAVHSFDFALYGPALGPQDCVICVSHRGTKRYTAEALARARTAGCLTVLITGEGGGTGTEADAVFSTVAQEKSSAHTVSYTGAIAVLATLSERLGQYGTGMDPFSPAFLSEDIPAALRAALRTEGAVAALARDHLHRRRIWLVGGGPSGVIAQEVALKIKETSYLQAEGMPIEAMLHGPFQCTEPEDLFVLIAPAGAAQARVVEFGRALREIGASVLVVSDGTPEPLREEAREWVAVPAVPEPFTALVCLVPLQLFTYHLALQRGTNPDGFRLEEPRFAQTHALVRL
jgi:glucosamine--fructose-6-phosphate aminotransferase (isomerizing)